MSMFELLGQGQNNILALASARIFNGYTFFKGHFLQLETNPTERKVLKDNLD